MGTRSEGRGATEGPRTLIPRAQTGGVQKKAEMPGCSEINSAGLWNGVVQLRQDSSLSLRRHWQPLWLRHATISMAQTLSIGLAVAY